MDTSLTGVGCTGSAEPVGRTGLDSVAVRAFAPEDEALYPDFLGRVSLHDRRLRFFSPAPLTARQIHRFTHFDPAEAVVLVAVGREDGRLYGVGRLHRVEGDQGEFAVLVRSDMKGRGIGRRLLRGLCDAAGTIGVQEVVGLILPENTCMRALATHLGFRVAPDPQERGLLRAALVLPHGAGARNAA